MVDPLMRVQPRLTDRDHLLLGWLADHGVLTSFQIAHALYPSLDFAQRRLRKLCEAGLIGRFRPFQAEGGTYPYHYLLDQLGVDVVASQRGDDIPRRDQARKRRWHLTNRANLPHLLATNQFFIDLAGHARTHPGTALQRWWPAARCQRLGAFAENDDDIQVKAYTPSVRPDGHGIWREHDLTVPFFAEIDLSSEPLWKLIDKLTGYAALAAKTGRVWPVLYCLTSPTRERHLHKQLAQDGIHWPVATTVRDQHLGKTVAENVWWLYQHSGGLLRLVDLAHTVTDRNTTA